MGFLSKKPGIFTGGAYVPTVFVGMYATQAMGEGWGIAFNRRDGCAT
jgi:hypothetical protein